MAKSIEPEVKDWFAQALSQHKTKYCIEQGTLNIEIENGDDWNFASHKKIDTTPTEEDFKAVVAAYLSYRVKCLMENK